MQTAFRLILTAALLVGVYSETGPWTTIALAFIALGQELVAFLLRRTTKVLNEAAVTFRR